MLPTRLISVQGASQLLDIMSILSFQDQEEKSSYNSILILGGFCVSNDKKVSSQISSAIREIASFGDFSAVYDISYLEYKTSRLIRASKKLSISLGLLKILSTLLRRSINVSNIEKIYVCRNWQHFNEILLFSYPNAEKICYGDLGILDINDNLQEKGLINPLGFIPIDKCYLNFPAEVTENASKNLGITSVNPNYKKELIHSICKSNVLKGLDSFCAKNLNNTTLITTSNGTEAGYYVSVFEEVGLYLSCTLSNTNTGDLIWIKPHPRETLNQSNILCELLNKSGRIAQCLDEFGRYPIELFIPYLSSTKIICLYSYSGIVSAVLGYKTIIVGLDDKLISIFIKKDYYKLFIDYTFRYANWLNRALDSNCDPTYKYEINSGDIDNSILGNVSEKSLPNSPLTNSANVVLLREYTSSSISQKWIKEFNIDICQELNDCVVFYLYQCIDTSLKFFTPSTIDGSESLYAQLSKFTWYYMSNKWEYKIALESCDESDKVLDLGCGRGEFVRLANRKGINITGIDMSSEFIYDSQLEILNIDNIDLESATAKYKYFFDVICCFQVLEHVSEPAKFINAILMMLKIHGRMILSVPNSESYLQYVDNLLDMPPHHMTKWSEETFRALENYFPIKIKKIIREPLAEYHVSGYVASYAYVYQKKYPLIAFLFNRYFRFFFRIILRLGLRRFFTGQSLYVEFIKV